MVAAVVLTATYLTWVSGRVDRLHARVAAADATLDAHLVRRAAMVHALAEEAGLADLASSAGAALAGCESDRQGVENQLTRTIRLTAVAGDPAWEPVFAANRRVALARQVHSDLVRDALGVRRRFVVRALRLASKHPLPEYFDIEDPVIDLTEAGRRAQGEHHRGPLG